MSDERPDRTPAEPPVPEPAPMLDVHPPHQAIHGWRDFFLHIVTITIGLLIAVGLEQTVEYIHHRQQLAEMEDSIRAEGVENQEVAAIDARAADQAIASAGAAIAGLQAAAGTGTVTALGEINLLVPGSSAWSAARDAGLLALAPHEQVGNYWKAYFVQDAVVQQVRKVYADLDNIQALASIHPDAGRLAAAERESLLAAYAGYREDLKVLKIDLDLLNRVTDLALRGGKIDMKSIYKS